MQQHNDLPGTPEWHQRRSRSYNASDAPAMLGCSPHESRSQLMARLHNGLQKDISDFQQARVIDPGHRFEAMARPLAEKVIGEELFPIGGSVDVGLTRPLGASYDGLTMGDDIDWEHKRLNEELRSALPHPGPDGNDSRTLAKAYRVQLEQQLLVSGAERALFTASDWELDKLSGEWTCTDIRHCWYGSDPELRAEIVAGWKQFDADLAAYTPLAAPQPQPVGRAPGMLPALRIEVTGQVTASNLGEFKETALSAIRSVNRQLTSDQHFADAEKAVKWCEEVESRIKAAKEHALSQTTTIEELFRTLSEISEEARTVRLDLDKLVKSRKQAIRGEIVNAGVTAYDQHIRALNDRLGRPLLASAYRNIPEPDFAGKISGLKSVDSIRNAVNTELARVKIAASEVADRAHVNLEYLRVHAADYPVLFADSASIVLKQPEDLKTLVTARIAEHKEAERQRQEREAAARREREEKEAAARAQQPMAAAPAAAVAPAPNVVPIARSTPATPPTMKLGEISARLGLVVTADFLKRMGFEGSKDRGAVLYHEADFSRMCDSLVAHIRTVQQQREAA